MASAERVRWLFGVRGVGVRLRHAAMRYSTHITLPFFFCFFSTIWTVKFFPAFHLISVPIALVRQSSSSSGSIR